MARAELIRSLPGVVVPNTIFLNNLRRENLMAVMPRSVKSEVTDLEGSFVIYTIHHHHHF